MIETTLRLPPELWATVPARVQAPLVEQWVTLRLENEAAGLCGELTKWWPALWTFARVDGVEPTNNVAERALRPAVRWRKGSFGSDSEAGSRFGERLLTVVATCRQQGRLPLDFLVAAGEAALRGIPSPSLLPVPKGG